MGGKGHHPSSSESDDWGDESWIVDCPCGVNYDDGEEMVECDECGVWVHTACCRVPKGLPTYVCDKCKIKKKESEESEVAQLLAELPSKTISFEERSQHERAEAYIAVHHNSSEISMEERAHVHGIPGGDPSFFVGVSKVFCRQLWKYTGYVPKSLKIDNKEIPEPREDVSELLSGLADFEVPISMDDRKKLAPLALENGHATLASAEMEHARDEELSKEETQVREEALKDKQGKDLQMQSGKGKHSNHRHKPQVKDEKSHHHGKRSRDEGGLKGQPSKKKPRNDGDACRPEEGQWKEVDVSPSQEAGLLGKSPLSSPKNPKAMKKLAVQEFMDGDVILCSVCGTVEPLLDLITGFLYRYVAKAILYDEVTSVDPAVWGSMQRMSAGHYCKILEASLGPGRDAYLINAVLKPGIIPLSSSFAGGSIGGGSDSLCQECERVRECTLLVTPKLETPSVKQESVAVPVPVVINTGTTLEVRFLSSTELGYTEGIKTVRFREEGNQVSTDGDWQVNPATPGKDRSCYDSSPDAKKVDTDVTDLHKSIGIHDSPKLMDEKNKLSVKMEANVYTVKQPLVGTKAREIFEDVDSKFGPTQAFESPAMKSVAASKAWGESAVRGKDLWRDSVHVLGTRSSCTDEAEACSPSDSKIALGGSKQAASVEGHLPVISVENLESLCKPAQVPPDCLPAVHSVPSTIISIPIETADRNGKSDVATLPSKLLSAAVVDVVEDRAVKLPAPIMSVEIKGQGSARTAGHLPVSVRAKMHGEKCNQQVQWLFSAAACQQQVPSLSGQSLVQVSFSGTQRSAQPSVAMVVSPSMKGNCSVDPVVGKQHGQVQPEGVPPIQQAAKHSPQLRSQIAQPAVADKLPSGLSEVSSLSQPSSSAQQPEIQQSKGHPGVLEPNHNEFFMLPSLKQPQVASASSPDTQILKPSSPIQAIPTQVLCQQARQLNGIGQVYTSRSKSVAGSLAVSSNCTSIHPPGRTLASQAPNSTTSNTKVSVTSLKSPSSGTTSSSPTSPLVTTPSSKPQLASAKVLESPPPQRSLSGGSTPNASGPHTSSKVLGSTTSINFNSKQVGTLKSAKSVPSLPVSPQSTKAVNMSKQSSRSASLPLTKTADGSSSVGKTSSGVVPSRGGNHTSSVGSVKDSAKNMTHSSSKTSTTGKTTAQPAVTKPPPPAKSSYSHVHTKGSSVSKQHGGPGSGVSKASALSSTTKYTATHHSRVGTSHKDEKPSMCSAPPVPKAMSTMPPPPPQVSTKRSPPTVLTSAVATTLKDEELALLLHQELNSSPRVPRVPRVRQTGASLQLVSTPTLLSAKGSGHKDHHLALRKRTRGDRHKDLCKSISQSSEEVGKGGGKRAEENKMEDGRCSEEKAGHFGVIDGNTFKDKSGVAGLLSTTEGNARYHGFAKGNLSIIVPGNDDAPDEDKKSPVDSRVVTLPGLIDAVLGSRGHQLSYEDVCEAVLPHWQKLRKPNGERYAYASHRQAVLDCLRNRSAWAHLVGRGPKTNPGRKRRRNESTTLSDTDDEDNEQLGFRDADDLDTSRTSKRMKELDGDKWEQDASDRQKSAEAASLDDVPKGKRKARRRRRVAIEDGTDGEDEPADFVGRGSGQTGVCKSGGGTSQEDEPEAESSPSSEEAVSNYSEEDEEMVVHRGIRNRRRPANESSGSEDDRD